MMRKLTITLLLFIGLHTIAQAQIRDSVTISIPPFTDTLCMGAQFQFTAVESSDTFSGASFRWYINGIYTGVAIDTLYTSAPADGDSVYCWLYFTNSLGIADSSRSNAIYVHRASSIPANVLISLIVGSNPDCAGHPLTFSAYPVNGGTNPTYQWMINGVQLPGEDSTTITRYFGGADTVSCRMVSNSSCAPVDTVYSVLVPIIHIHLTAAVSIGARYDTLCAGTIDTLTAYGTDYGSGASFQWYRDSVAVTGATSYLYVTDSLHEGDSVYCVMTTVDTCVLNPVSYSNTIRFEVYHVYPTFATMSLTAGDNPGCLDSPVTFTATVDTFLTTPFYAWYVNGVLASVGTLTFTGTFANTDVVSFDASTVGGCYTSDSVHASPVVMIRDPHPIAPWVSLINDTLVADSTLTLGATYTWYYGIYPTGTIIPGATGPVYHPSMLGDYYCIKDSSNCNSGPSNVIYISLLSVNDVAKPEASIYPNPTTGTLSIQWGGQIVNQTLDIVNSVGNSLVHADIKNKSRFETDLSALPDGLYYLNLRNEDGSSKTYKVCLNRN